VCGVIVCEIHQAQRHEEQDKQMARISPRSRRVFVPRLLYASSYESGVTPRPSLIIGLSASIFRYEALYPSSGTLMYPSQPRETPSNTPSIH